MNCNDLIVVVNNVSSITRMLDFVRMVYGFGVKNLVLTRVYGAAAQQGVGEAFKIAVRHSASLLVLPDALDAINLLAPDRVVVLRRIGGGTVDLARAVEGGGKIMIIVDGSDQELKLPNSIEAHSTQFNVGGIAMLAIGLDKLMQCLNNG
ncbi:recombinase RecA [Thermocladium modestius]|uniref:Recombinase RecA n=1 Tax=Thermocladium modestius TaxID=62609 RepID=A0A830GVI7_9CREN|nr:RecB-family nuclease [Thermocladium modestius]GGP20569.1 recombinase RecA [Thermocladium modestius]